MEPDALGWDPVLRSWLADTPPVMNSWLRNFLHESLFRRFCDPILYWSHHEHVQVFICCLSSYSSLLIFCLNELQPSDVIENLPDAGYKPRAFTDLSDGLFSC